MIVDAISTLHTDCPSSQALDHTPRAHLLSDDDSDTLSMSDPDREVDTYDQTSRRQTEVTLSVYMYLLCILQLLVEPLSGMQTTSPTTRLTMSCMGALYCGSLLTLASKLNCHCWQWAHVNSSLIRLPRCVS